MVNHIIETEKLQCFKPASWQWEWTLNIHNLQFVHQPHIQSKQSAAEPLFVERGCLACSACRRVWTSLCIRLIWITHTTMLQCINTKAPTNGECSPLTKHAWSLWQMCESVSAHKRMCASMCLHGSKAQDMFLAALLPHDWVRVHVRTCHRVFAPLCTCLLMWVLHKSTRACTLDIKGC